MTEQAMMSGRSAKDRLRWVWQEGVARRVVVEKDARRPIDLPLVAFLVAAVLAPWLVALGGVAGIVLGYQFRVERAVAPGDASPHVEEPAGDGEDAAGSGQPG